MTMTNTIDQDREDYQNWRTNVFKQKYVFNEDGSGYKDGEQCIEWESWQASAQLQRERQVSEQPQTVKDALEQAKICDSRMRSCYPRTYSNRERIKMTNTIDQDLIDDKGAELKGFNSPTHWMPLPDLMNQLCPQKDNIDELLEAAKAVVKRWESPKWKEEPHTTEFISRLRNAIKGLTMTQDKTIEAAKAVIERWDNP